MINHKGMDEAAVERACERAMDRYDRRLLNGELTQAEYDEKIRELNKWAHGQVRRSASW